MWSWMNSERNGSRDRQSAQVNLPVLGLRNMPMDLLEHLGGLSWEGHLDGGGVGDHFLETLLPWRLARIAKIPVP